MVASIDDKFNKAGDGNTAYPVVATVSATRTAGDSVLTCEDLTGWATETAVHFTTYKLTATGTVDSTSQTDWKGVVVNNTITQMRRIRGAADSGNAIGDVVELNPTIGWLDDIITGLLQIHKQDGTLKDGIINSAALASQAVTAAKIADGTITNAKLGAQCVKSDNVDWASTRLINMGTSTVAVPAVAASSIYRVVVTPPVRDGYVTLNHAFGCSCEAGLYVSNMWDTSDGKLSVDLRNPYQYASAASTAYIHFLQRKAE